MTEEPKSEGKKSGGLSKLWADTKAHPYIASGVVFVVGAVLIYLYYSGSSSAAAPATASDSAAADNASYLQAQLQSQALQAQYGAQTAQTTAAANAAAQQIQGSVSVAQLNDQAAIDQTNSNNQTAKQIAALQAALGTTTVNDQTSASEFETATTGNVDLANISAGVDEQQLADSTQVALGAQTTGVLSQLLTGIFSQPQQSTSDVFSGSFNNPTNTSTNNRIATLIPQVQAQPASTLYTQQQVEQLLQG